MKNQNCFVRRVVGNQQGYILITVYFLMAAASIITLANCMHNYSFIKDCERQRNAIVALEMAESGVDNALVTLASNTSYAGTGTGYPVTMSLGSSRGAYDTTISTPSGAPSNIRKIVVNGHAPDAAAVNSPSTNAENLTYKLATENVYVQLPASSYFNMAVFALNSLEISGHPTIDSYISANGAYAAGSARSNGDVGTNGTASGVVNLSGSSTIKGDVWIGAGGNTGSAITLSGHPTITGSRSAQTTNPTFPTPTAPSSSSGNLTIGGNSTVTLAAGTYVYTNISITGSGKLQSSGAVTIYATGTVDIGGGGVAASSNIPANLKIYVTSNIDVHVTGNSALYAALYAPLSTIELGGTGDIYGAVVSKVLNVSGNGNIHYDESLANASGSSNTTSVLTWIQTGNQNWTN